MTQRYTLKQKNISRYGDSKPRSQSRRLFEALSASHPLKLSESEFEQEFSDLLPALSQQGFLQKTEPSLEVICPALPNNCLVTAQRSNGRYYVHCECSDEVGLVEIDPKHLKRLRFDLPAFLKWVAFSALVDGDLKEVESGTLWYLGEKTLRSETAKIYFSRIDDAEKIQQLENRLQKDDKRPIILWLGETPHVGYSPANIISLPEITELSKKEFSLSRNRIDAIFVKKLTTKSGDIELDKHIALHKKGRKKYFLLLNKEKIGYENEVSIYPQSYEIIRHLYQIRNSIKAETLPELEARGSMAVHKRTILTRIKEINEICDRYGVKKILKKTPPHKWGLNPDLDRIS